MQVNIKTIVLDTLKEQSVIAINLHQTDAVFDIMFSFNSLSKKKEFRTFLELSIKYQKHKLFRGLNNDYYKS